MSAFLKEFKFKMSFDKKDIKKKNPAIRIAMNGIFL